MTPALGVMTMITRRGAATLLPIINRHIRPGSIVWSDEWRAYRRVQQLALVTQHQTINHSIQFVDLVTGVHTQNVESYWTREIQMNEGGSGEYAAALSGQMYVARAPRPYIKCRPAESGWKGSRECDINT